jgi:hypothetical protein
VSRAKVLAKQEAMQFLALSQPSRRGVFLFEDHKIARASFLLPAGCSKSLLDAAR